MCTDGIAPFRRLPPAALSTAQWNSFSQRASVSYVVLFHLRLTTPGFRQRADRERTFTASAPPGMRPPPSRRSGADDDATADSVVGVLVLGRDHYEEFLGDGTIVQEVHEHAKRMSARYTLEDAGLFAGEGKRVGVPTPPPGPPPSSPPLIA